MNPRHAVHDRKALLMFATSQDLEVLAKLQEIDRSIASAQKEFDEMPHRNAILEVRRKKEDVFKKKVQVQDLLDVAEGKLIDLENEEEKLSEKQREVEAALAEVQGDYRAVTAHTRDLDGVRKRREKVSLALDGVTAEIARIEPVMKQVMAALDALEGKEKELIASFQKTGTALRSAIIEGEEGRKDLACQLSPELLAAYEEARTQCGGVALAHLVEDTCGTCRNSFNPGKLGKIKSEAPLTVCPACHRLLIVEE